MTVSKTIDTFQAVDWLHKFSFSKGMIRVEAGHYAEGMKLLEKVEKTHWTVEESQCMCAGCLGIPF